MATKIACNWYDKQDVQYLVFEEQKAIRINRLYLLKRVCCGMYVYMYVYMPSKVMFAADIPKLLLFRQKTTEKAKMWKTQ